MAFGMSPILDGASGCCGGSFGALAKIRRRSWLSFSSCAAVSGLENAPNRRRRLFGASQLVVGWPVGGGGRFEDCRVVGQRGIVSLFP